MQTYGRFDVAIDHGLGAKLYSPEGEEYIDFTSGIGVNCLGYGNKKWADAVYQQALKLQHISNLYYSEPYAKLAHSLITRSGMKNVFFANAGGEANEGMIKCARKYSFDKYGKGRSTIITLKQSFHGRTITTLAATGQDSFHNFFFPFTEGFRYVAAGDIAALKSELKGDVCAVMVELIQGEGGVLPLDKEYINEVSNLCNQNDVLLLVDEVQTGVGRTGELFAYQLYGVMPDIVSFAKGIAGGLPMGGFMCSEKTMSTLTPGTHATTFGGNPIAAAAASVVMEELSESFLQEVSQKGKYIMSAVSSWKNPIVSGIRGMGLMIGVSVTGIAPRDIMIKCIDNGLLVLTAGTDTIRMLPPLTITYEEIDSGLNILKNVLEELS